MRFQHWVYTIPLWLRSLLRRDRLDAELDEELRDHIDRQIEDNMFRGMSPEEARVAAMRRFGNPALLRNRPAQHGAGTDSSSACAIFGSGFAR